MKASDAGSMRNPVASVIPEIERPNWAIPERVAGWHVTVDAALSYVMTSSVQRLVSEPTWCR